MLFNSFIFLSVFLPAVLLINLFLSIKWSNVFLLTASMFFYYWGEPQLILLLMLSILWNYGIGIIVDKNRKKHWLMIGALGNIAVLFYYKYMLFFVETFSLHSFFDPTEYSHVTLPIGISFFTFQGISYIIDVYRKDAKAEINLIKVSLYISFFPQLVAGPIVKFREISTYISNRKITHQDISEGSFKLIRGLFKKIVLANNFAIVSDAVFGLESHNIPFLISWIGVLFYTLQIYYDFSGYSDIAIGIARMMGFHINENFKHPYSSSSFKDFWRRWHISLSTWFKEYVYIPLGGNRVVSVRLYINLVIVFFLTGLWHGANMTFIVWGLLHGAFLVLNRVVTLPTTLPLWVKRITTTLVVAVLWVFFRSETLSFALDFLGSMVQPLKTGSFEPLMHINGFVLSLAILGVIFTFPIRSKWVSLLSGFRWHQYSTPIFYILLLLWSLVELLSTSHQSFIYFQF